MIDPQLERCIIAVPELGAVTPEVVADAMQGFLLPLPDVDWLAAAIRGALYVARQSEDERADRPGNRRVREELHRIAGRLAVLWDDLGNPELSDATLDYAHRGGEPFGEAEDFQRFQEAQANLEWLGVFLRRAGMMLDVQDRGWRQRAERDGHILRARCLALIYREAFDLEPTAHSRPTKQPLPWPDFYQRIMGAVFGKPAVNDLMGMLAEALEAEAESPLTIEGKFWPDKPCE